MARDDVGALEETEALREAAEGALSRLAVDGLYHAALQAGDEGLLTLASRLQALYWELEERCEVLTARVEELLPAALAAWGRQQDEERRRWQRDVR